jgi:hypothetical protein
MSCRRRVCATVITVAACLLCCVWVVAGRAWAGDDEDAHFMLFSGRDLWRHAAFGYTGVVFAPGGFDQDGLLLKILLSDSLYLQNDENLRHVRVTGVDSLTQALPGWRIKRGAAELKFFFGLESQRRYLWLDDPSNRPQGRLFGLRLAAELWYEPTPDSMIAADASLSSIATGNSARIGYGWRVLEDMLGGVYVGPEIQYFGSDGYRHLRLGAHITSMKTDDIEWSAAAGWASDSQGRTSPYLRLNVLKKL